VKKSLIIAGAVAAAVVAVSFWALQVGNEAATSDQDASIAASNSDALPSSASSSTTATTTVATAMSPPPSDEADEFSEDPVKMFQADSAGNLAFKERTRINVEKILWAYSPDEQKQKLAAIEQTLPPSAYRQLTELMDRYQNFTLAAKQSYPPNVAPATVEDAIAQHEGLSALRKAHFGANAAEAMFGHEEKLNRQLLELMSLEKHEGMTMDEKAMKAQEMLSKSPELQAVYERNRNASTNAD
jgi:hypothetical protein